jgi:hypothetical protein
MEIINSLANSNINWLSVAAVTILSFILGALWHSSVLFGRIWAKEINKDKNQKINFKLVFGLSAIANLVAVIALAAFIGDDSTAIKGLIDGLVVSIFWISSSIAVTYLFESKSLKLFLIDAGFYIIFFSIAGFIIGTWQ